MKRRSTASKEEVLAVLKAEETAMSHDMLQSKLSVSMDRATIYRILNRFCEDGQVHKFVGDDGKQYFALCINCGDETEHHHHNHFHFKCLECGKVECLRDEVEVSLPKGYVTRSFNGFISGVCAGCSSLKKGEE